ncbi:UDP-galactose-4-epimerase [Flavobacterium rivuli WB 3.3-2 = DSM 21788]|uniref:UDP-glucose 4-epimerase n=1 Tax=Flavobacterium rivuli WB 3.3-2 = DSM 21788 TaxID=1121895 RepID=A0A0A2MGL1_9FLAO|nr:UDP-glucose 4-epimerase GalE [Flavobacterium rivuli]KGO87450.1 UDP-galactose-4-epimerase [Flavobacterium rivuli WB 3.3-2 = DSM 21788]
MSKILVTGGTGYIGSHTVVELYNAGFEVLIVDNFSNSDPGVLNQIETITGKRPECEELDLCDEAKVKEYMDAHKDITGIIHFAAYKAVGESVREPMKYYKNNLYSLINLIENIDGKINFVFSSSCTVYGQPEVLPVTEDAPVQKAESPYGNTKQIAEEILTDTCAVTPDLKVISLRYFNPVGAHESGLIGELPIGVPNCLVPFITQSAIGKRGPIVVHGNDYNTPDGSALRDYIHVVDLAKAHVSALNRLQGNEGKSNYEVFNLGTGKGTSVLEVIDAFEKSTGEKLNYSVGPRRSGDVEKVWGDVTKSSKELKWTAGLGIEEMMSSAWKWEKYIKENPFN